MIASFFILACCMHGVLGQRPGSPDQRLPQAASETVQVVSACPPHGLHHFPDLSSCDGYYTCLGGSLLLWRRCPAGLHFNRRLAAKLLPCDRPEHADCEALLDPNSIGFLCPVGPSVKLPLREKSVHRSPDSCREFFVCAGGVPKRHRCHLGQVFNEKLSICSLPEKVPGCEDYYSNPKTVNLNKESKKEFSARQDALSYENNDPKETVFDPNGIAIVNGN